MKGFLIALQFLTRLPGPRMQVSGAEFSASMRWFPAVGLVVGLCVAGAVWAGMRVDPWVGALLGLVAWVGVTGALHLDGLGDIADALGAAHKDSERLKAVLADPHVGSFGVTAIGMQLLAKLVLLHLMAERQAFLALVLIPFAARMGPLVWARTLPPLHAGLGSQFRDAVGARTYVFWSLALGSAMWFLPALAATIFLVIICILWIRSSLGGISGDGHGAGIEIIETCLLLAMIISGGTR